MFRFLIAVVVLGFVCGSDTTAAPPYPPSPMIEAMEWAPKETIKRAAKDGDNWPVRDSRECLVCPTISLE
jgi:hypothetical protein